MNTHELLITTHALLSAHKGLLAMDESTSTCNARFAELGIAQTVEARRSYRELLITTPRLHECISGAILVDETIRQSMPDGRSFVDVLTKAGILPGIKVDLGVKELAGFPGEKITEGLDGLRQRLTDYRQMGARFAKWRVVISLSESGSKLLPTTACVEANMHDLARFAALCQEADLVPIVEPEVLMAGSHSIARCEEVTERVLRTLFRHLNEQQVQLEGMILKTGMVVAGYSCTDQATADEVAAATLRCLKRTVPAAVPGVAFLSGGQTPDQASTNLNAMHVYTDKQVPWVLTFSFARAIQQPAMALWNGQSENVAVAQKSLLYRAGCNSAATMGKYRTADHTVIPARALQA
ncbi:class I fructose-bisphosphate aldolase [Fibrivirga algicola]|uniref:fructose-bisphosphate aldolase n=1 Tax=Fibrivirga algicola TaxID=2950420 RepID=A0ABX0QLW0_9BACT|nr:class I fructose-bisphosphate aldolase [Fibrivirga algicola]NID13481.1 fructose-bisphosphate aldolase class I [Fibrivirga algicola]